MDRKLRARKGHALGRWLRTKHLLSFACTTFGRGARQWEGVGLHEFVGSEIRRRTQAAFVMVGEAPIFVR